MLQNYKKILDDARSKVCSFSQELLKGTEMAFEGFEQNDIEKLSNARKLLKNAHKRANDIDNEIIKTLALFSPEASDLRVLVTYLKITNELTRMSDYIRGYAKIVKMEISGEFELDELKENALAFHRATLRALEAAIESIKEENDEKIDMLYRKVNVEESKCDDVFSIMEKNILQQICLLPEQAGDFIEFLDGMRKLERLSDRSVTLVKLAMFASHGGKLKL